MRYVRYPGGAVGEINDSPEPRRKSIACPNCGFPNTVPTVGNNVGNTMDCPNCFTDFTPLPEEPSRHPDGRRKGTSPIIGADDLHRRIAGEKPAAEEPPELKEALRANLNALEKLVSQHELAEEDDEWNYDDWKWAYDDTHARIHALFASLSSQLERQKAETEIAEREMHEHAAESGYRYAQVSDLESQLERLKAEQQDAQIVAGFIVGWWPGLEDALYWPKDADEPESNKVYAAAKRILGRQSDTGEG